MKAEEFLIQQCNRCFWMTHDNCPENIVMVYDKQHERKLKLNSLNNTNDDIYFIKTNESKVLFFQDNKFGYLHVNYDEIWYVLLTKYGIIYDDIIELISNTLLNDSKTKKLNLICNHNLHEHIHLSEKTKIVSLVSKISETLLDDNKLRYVK